MFDPVVFDALPIAVDDGMIIRSGLLFRAGEYKAQNFTATPDTLRKAVATFTGSGMVELEHFRSINKPSILDGKIGTVRKLWTNEDGTELHGEVALPAFIDERHAEYGRKISAVWNRPTGAFTGIGLVLDPQVSDAALMSAYATFAGKRHSAGDQADMQTIHDIASKQGASCPDPSPNEAGGNPEPQSLTTTNPTTGFARSTRMKFSEWLTGKAKEEGVELEDAATFGTATPDPRVAELERKLAAQEAERAADKAIFAAASATQRTTDAALFADAQVVARTILPAGRDALAALYATLAEADANGATVTFSDGKTGGYIETLTAVFAALPGHTLTSTTAFTKEQVLMARTTPDPNAPMTAERRAHLLSLSNFGQAIANGKAN